MSTEAKKTRPSLCSGRPSRGGGATPLFENAVRKNTKQSIRNNFLRRCCDGGALATDPTRKLSDGGALATDPWHPPRDDRGGKGRDPALRKTQNIVDGINFATKRWR